MAYEILDNGLIVNHDNCALGYIFSLGGKNYTPNGNVGIVFDQEQIDRHNKALSVMELEEMIRSGYGVMYLTEVGGIPKVQQWDCNITPIRIKKSWHNMAGRNGRLDVWFYMPEDKSGKVWHGVNIGDNQILRVKRNK
jgi:hypothetical protein